jgi:hypothetical protein
MRSAENIQEEKIELWRSLTVLDSDLTILANQVEARRQSVLCSFETGKMMEKATGDDSSSIFLKLRRKGLHPTTTRTSENPAQISSLSRSAGLIGLV